MTTMILQAVDSFILAIARQRIATIIFVAFAIQVLNMYVVTLLVDTDATPGFQFDSPRQAFIASVILGPFLETLIFQEWMIMLSIRYLRTSSTIAILLSGITFGLSHPYSIAYIVVTSYIGMFYGILYLAFRGKKVNAFLLVTLIHSLYNLFVFVMNRLILNP